MSRIVGSSRSWRAGAAIVLSGLIVSSLPAQSQRRTVQVGQITAVAEASDIPLATALAEAAGETREWYGIGARNPGSFAIMVTRRARGLDGASGRRFPDWGAGFAIPSSRIIGIRVGTGDPFQTLRHEVAHLVLRSSIRGRVPLWFDEGYATVAAGEFGGFDALQLNLGVALGNIPSLGKLDGALRGGAATAPIAYSLAATAVLYLARRNPSGELAPLINRLNAGEPFDSAVAMTTGLSPARFDEAWQRDVRRRHSVMLWLVAGGMWAVLGTLLIVVVQLRRRRDAGRRAALDVGWVIPVDEGSPAFQDETNDRPPS